MKKNLLVLKMFMNVTFKGGSKNKLLMALLFLMPFCAFAQPEFYNLNNSGGANIFPLGGTTNKVQWIYGPAIFNSAGPTGTPAYSGLITKVYWRLSAAPTAFVYNDFSIALAQNVGTQNSWTNGTYNTPMVTCFSQATYSLAGAGATGFWVGVTLQTPFLYDPAQSLVFQLQASNAGNNSVSQSTTTGLNQRIWGTFGSTTGSFGTALVDFGFDLIPSGPCSSPPTAGTTVTSATSVCLTGPLILNLTGNSIGSGQTYQWESSPTINGTYTPVSTVLTTSYFAATGTATLYYRCAVTCGTSTSYSNPVLVTLNPPFPGGVYTINSALPTGGTNFQSFTAAAAALACGISSSVVFNVAPNSGPYNEQITINEVFNTSSSNTVLFNGNGNTITFAPTALNRHIIKLDKASYVAFSNLNVVGTDPINGVGFLLTNNANFNIINNCTIDLTATFGNAGTTSAGIVIAGSTTAYTTAGATGTNNAIVFTTIKGGYYGISMIGNSALQNSTNNIISNCSIQDFYFYGIYLVNVSNSNISKNEIFRPTRANISSYYGLYHATSGSNNVYDANKFHSAFAAAPTSTLTAYPIFHSSVKAAAGFENKVTNNAIYNNNFNGLYYAIYNSASDSIHYLHNTISMDDAASTATSAARAFYQLTAGNGIVFRNNIISITRGGTGLKHGIYLGTAIPNFVSNNNVIHINAPAGTNHVGFYSSNQTTLANWQAVNSGAFDQNSTTLSPNFISAAQGLLYPLNTAIDNLGAPLGVLTDITSASRSTTTPDIGAYEFQPIGKDIEISNLITSLEPCFGPNDTLKATIKNIAANSINFAVDTLTINWSISGASTASGTATISSGTIAGGATMIVNLTNNINISTLGTHVISATVNSAWDQIPNNNLATRSITVNPVSITASSTTVCTGSPVYLSIIGTTGPVQWQANTGSGFVNIPGATQPSVSYNVSASVGLRAQYCGNQISNVITVNPLSISPPTTTGATVCAGTNGTLTATASVGTLSWHSSATGGTQLGTGSNYVANAQTTTNYFAQAYQFINSAVATVGTGTASNTSTSYPAVFGNWYGGTRNQFLYRASEMSAAGAVPGQINSIAFNVTNVNTAVAHIGFTIYIKATSTTALTAHEGGVFTQVFGPVTHMPVLGWNTFNFSTPFIWNGTDNIVIETCFNNLSFTQNASTEMTTLSYIASRYFIADNNPAVCTTLTGTTTNDRPNARFDQAFGCTSTRTPATLTVNPKPVVNAGPDLAICTGNTATFSAATATSGTGALSYSWTPTTGLNNAAILNPAANPTASASYILSVTDAAGCNGKDTLVLTVNALPTVTANASSAAVCAGTSVTLTGSGSGAGTPVYTWDNGVVNGSSFIPTNTTLYTVTSTDANNCSSTNQVTVTVNPLPVIVGTATATTLCDGDQVTLTATGAPTISWDKMVVDGVAFVPTMTDTYTVTGTDANNCSDTDQITVVVNPLPNVEANVTATTVCLGEQVTFNGSGADTYVWTNGVDNNVPFTPQATQSYTVTGTDVNNCVNTDEIIVNVNPLPVVIANATATAICFGDQVTLTGSGADTYTWTNNVVDGVAFNPSATLSYTVKGTDANNCSNEDDITITVNPLPVVTLDNFKPVCFNAPAFDLTGGTPLNGSYYLNGASPVTSFNPKDYTIGFHTVTYSFTDANGCTSTAQGLIEVSECVGIAETTFGAGSVNIYPNPANNQFTIEINMMVNEAAELMIYNANGKLVKTEKSDLKVGNNKIKFDTNQYARGVYYIQILTNSGRVNQKLILN
jgi:parallel beta-helix repeat protein